MTKTMSDLPKTAVLIGLAVLLVCSAAARSVLLPFLSALLLAFWADVPVTRLEQKLPRPLSAAVVLTIAGLLVCNLTLLLGVQLWRAMAEAVGALWPGEDVFPALSRLSHRLPGALGAGAAWVTEQLQNQSGLLHTRLEEQAARLTTATAAALPRILLSWGITLLAAFYACADWVRVRQRLARLVPASWQDRLRHAGHRLAQGALGWVRVQGRLFLIQLVLLWAGLALLGRGRAFSLALVTAAADALPLLGSGVVLLPLALGALLGGDWLGAGGLTALWVVSALCRSAVEPKLLGSQTGRSPLLSLLVLYGGLRIWGVPGLVVAPIVWNAVCGQRRTDDRTGQKSSPA